MKRVVDAAIISVVIGLGLVAAYAAATQGTRQDSQALLVFILAGALYFLPTIVAKTRKVENAAPTFIINLFLGWTFIGWVVALAMGAGARTRDH